MKSSLSSSSSSSSRSSSSSSCRSSSSSSSSSSTSVSGGATFVCIGEDTATDGFYSDEVRVSNVSRYSANFTPPTVSFSVDGGTIALWHFDVSPGAPWNFDDGKRFDQSYDAFLQGITRYKLGTGNKNTAPNVTGFALQNVFRVDDITSFEFLEDRTNFIIIVPPEVAKDGISELGLFQAGDFTMVAAFTFPNINKQAGTELRIVVTIFK